MKYQGKVKEINHIVVSDPSYEKGVWCRYEKENLNEKNWLANFMVNEVEFHEDDFSTSGIDICVLLSKNEDDCKLLEDGSVEHLSNIDIDRITIGMDTACVALGLNSNAQEIIDSKDEWQPNCSLLTHTDGTFGEVIEGIKDGNLAFVLMTGYLDSDTGYDVEGLTEYLVNQLDITDLTKVMNDKATEL